MLCLTLCLCVFFCFFKKKTAYEMRISDWSSDVLLFRSWISQLKHYENAKKKKNPMNWTGPVLAGGRLILVSTEGDLVNVDPSDGSIQSKQELNGGMSLDRKSVV